MKKFFLHILLVGVLGMLAVSCSDEFDSLGLDSNKTQVVFSIGMDSPIARSRAAWGEGYNPSDGGDAYDNRINPDQLYVKITHGGQTYDVKKILKWQDGKNLSSHTFVGEVDIDLKGQTKTMENARIEVFANWNPDAENGNVFSQGADYIPMWGVQTADITLAPGKREELQTIYLLRAMAKLQVCLTEEMASEYALKSVTLNKHNATGFCMPTLPTNGISDTKDLGLENVLNAKTSDEQVSLPLSVVQNGKDYVVYLPEIVNDGLTDEDLLKITVQLAEKKDGKLTGNTEEGNFFIKDYADADNPKVIDIVRNHWYKYEIKGFAASEIQVDFSIRTWDEYFIEVGMGYLFLNKNLIEMFNTNIDLDQLKFSSSSPITSIELLDVYKHELSGRFHVYEADEEQDEKDAYFVDKLGNLKSLQTENPTIYGSIGATWDKDVLSGDIRIKSPFVGDDNSDIEALKHDSHYNTVRYLEFKVTNAHGMWTTFRVEQYPPVVITNEKGYFSYRSDYLTHSINDDGIPTHYLHWKDNFKIYSSGFNVVHIHEHDDTKHDPSIHGNEEGEINTSQNYQKYQYDEYCWGGETATTAKYKPFWEEIMNGQVSYSTVHPVGRIYRYDATWRAPNAMGVTTNPAMGPTYEEDGKLYKKHYTGNIFYYFWSRYVDETVSYEGNNKGKSLICCMTYNNDNTGYTAVNGIYPTFQQDFTNQMGNSRMYHIRTTIPGNYILGFPELEDDNGESTTDPTKGHTVVSEENSRKVSPSFMVASELGKTFHLTEAQYKIDGVLPGPMIEFHYDRAVNQCKYYVEATYVDVNGDGKYTEGKDEVKHYDDWRLPTAAEVEVIKFYQSNSRAMDVVMNGEKYLCATPGYLSATVGTESGQYMRCVRDVKENK